MPCRLRDIYPKGGEINPVEKQYYKQDCWLLEKLAEEKPPFHVCCGGRMDGFVGQYAAMGNNVKYVDINKPPKSHPNIDFMPMSLTNLHDFGDNELPSLSCMHTIEHIGLGRYGDSLNNDGWKLALKELQRVTAVGGNLYLSVPLGMERVRFNAHRIFYPTTIIRLFSERFILLEFSNISDEEKVYPNVDQSGVYRFGLGLFHYRKVK